MWIRYLSRYIKSILFSMCLLISPDVVLWCYGGLCGASQNFAQNCMGPPQFFKLHFYNLSRFLLLKKMCLNKVSLLWLLPSESKTDYFQNGQTQIGTQWAGRNVTKYERHPLVYVFAFPKQWDCCELNIRMHRVFVAVVVVVVIVGYIAVKYKPCMPHLISLMRRERHTASSYVHDNRLVLSPKLSLYRRHACQITKATNCFRQRP